MTTVLTLPSTEERQFIDAARLVMQERYAVPPIRFDDDVWDFSPYVTRSARGRTARVVWRTTDSAGANAAQCDRRFLDVVKAHCIHRRLTPGTIGATANNARYLWRAIEERLGVTGQAFAWRDVNEVDLDRMLDLMRLSLGGGLYTAELSINAMIDKLHKAHVTSMARRPARTKQPERPGTLRPDGTVSHSHKLPTTTAIEALAEIRCRDDLRDYDRLLAELTLLGILVGIRGGEILSVLDDCLRPDLDGALKFHFFREKAAGGRPVDDAVPVFDVWREDVVECVDRIRAITDGPRRRAAELEQDGLVLPGYADDDRITSAEAAALLGCDSSNIVKYRLGSKIQRNLGKPKKVGEIPGTLRGVHVTYRAGEIRERLLESYTKRSVSWRVVSEGGVVYPLSRSLTCVWWNFGDRAKSENRLLVEPLRLHDWNRWLRGRTSVFNRLGESEQHRAVELRSHEFRHLHTTLLRRGNVTTEDIMRVMRRKNPQSSRQLQSYLHLTQEERVTRLASEIKQGTVIGGVADARRISLPAEVAASDDDVFVPGRVIAVHVTPFGSCTHSFGTSPCPKHVGCLDDCGDYCVSKNDTKARQNLVTLRRRTARARDDARIQAASGEIDLAPEWFDRQDRLVNRIDNVLEALDAASEGSVVQPFAGSPSRAVPLSQPSSL